MSKIDLVQSLITGYGYDGEGVCRQNGKVCFVKYALKDEEIKFKIVKENSSFCVGKLLEVLNPSVLREEPLCPYFGVCGGCAYQHTSYANEIDIKKDLLAGQLRKINFTNEIEVIPSHMSYGYRNKIRLFVEGNKIGYKKHSDSEVCDIEKCLIADEKINNVVEKIRMFISSHNIFDVYSEIVIRSEDNCLINFIMKKNKDINYQGLYLLLSGDVGIYQTFEGKSEHKMGLKFLLVDDAGIKCEYGISSFHQVNKYIAPLLYKKVCENTIGDTIINCYSGGGLLSCKLAEKFKRVIGIELGNQEHAEAEKMKENNNIFNLVNIHGDCAAVLPSIEENIDTIIIDPPRAGISDVVANTINSLNCRRLIYVSCNSATLVRDLGKLTNFVCNKVFLYDMFARTGEYEILAVVDRKL